MAPRNYFFVSFLFIFILSALLLSGAEIKFYDCNRKELDPEENVYAEQWQKTAGNVINNQDIIDCLPRNWKRAAEAWKKYFIINIMICKEKLDNPNDCGNLGQDNYIIVPTENNSGCGCAEATILHEFIHLAGPAPEDKKTDRKVRGCEKLILTGLIKNCRENPPTGDPCDCVDNEGNPSPCRGTSRLLLDIKRQE